MKNQFQLEHPASQLPTDHQGMYVLELFKYIGDQRLKTFNYYALILAATTAATFTAVDRLSHEVLLLCGVMHIVVASVFYMIDCRNCMLLWNVRGALRQYELASKFPVFLSVMNRDEKRDFAGNSTTIGDTETPSGWHPQFTYTQAFRIAYASQAMLGLGLITWVLLGEPRLSLPVGTRSDASESTVGKLLQGGEH